MGRVLPVRIADCGLLGLIDGFAEWVREPLFPVLLCYVLYCLYLTV